jgi:WD40 repeat protein
MVLSLLALLWLCACSSHTVFSTKSFTLAPPVRTPQNISLVAPTVGLFVGVSEYGDRAGMNSTPAHTLGAALMYSSFYNAATTAERDSRKVALGLPEDNYFHYHSSSVCAVAYSPDGTRFATADDDGTVVLTRSDLQGAPVRLQAKLGKSVIRSCSLAFGPDGTKVATGNEDGTISIWRLDRPGDPVVLHPPKPAWTISYNRDGTKLLITSYGGGAAILSEDPNSQAVVLPYDGLCFSVPQAAFSPDGRLVASSGCKDVQISSVDDPMAQRRLGNQTSAVYSLEFSHDGTRVVTTGWDGTRIWAVKGTEPPRLFSIPPRQGLAAGSAYKAIFSPDDSRIAIGYVNGFVQLWNADGSGDPKSLGNSGGGIKDLAFSPDGEYILKVSDKGIAWIRDVAEVHPVMFMPLPDGGNNQWYDSARYDALKKGRLPPQRTLAIRAAAFDASSKRVLVGYDDGTVAVEPGGRPDPKRVFRVDDLELLADLKAREDTPGFGMAIEYLLQADGVAEQMSMFQKDNGPEESAIYYVGSGDPVTRTRIFESLSGSIAKAKRALKLHHRVILVVYVAAHGWIGPDGKQYLLPSDADADDPKTWISYGEFLQPIREFLAAENNASPSGDESANNMSKLALVVFDTCQVARLNESGSFPVPDLSQRNLWVIQSTSPGRYAWHWTATQASKENITVDKETRWGFPPPPKAQRGLISTSLSTRMSLLPVASQKALTALAAQAPKTNSPAKNANSVGPMSSDDPNDDWPMISAGVWMHEIRAEVDYLLKEVPDASNPQLGRRAAQEVQLQFDPEQDDFWLFRVTRGIQLSPEKAHKNEQ